MIQFYAINQIIATRISMCNRKENSSSWSIAHVSLTQKDLCEKIENKLPSHSLFSDDETYTSEWFIENERT